MVPQEMGVVFSPLSDAYKIAVSDGWFLEVFVPVLIAASLGNVLHSWHLRLLQAYMTLP